MGSTIKVGIAGARGLSGITALKAMDNVEVAALCDLNEDVLKVNAAKYGIPRTYRVYNDMLDADIDAVIVATPMQYHFEQTVAALEAGKHVMSEVTAGVTMDELWWLVEAVKRSGRVYMMAENYCYIPEMQLVRTLARQGMFGELYFGEGEYLHDIRGLAVYPDGKTSWRSYWQLGKRGAFYPTHSLGPIMQCFEGERIRSVASFGTGSFTAPRFRQDDTSITLVTLESGKLIKLRIDCISSRPHNMSYYTLQGTKGCYEAPRGLGDEHKVYFSNGAANSDGAAWRPLRDFWDYLPERYINATEAIKQVGHWGGDYFIMFDFINAILTGEKPAIDVYEACEWTAVAMLSEASVTNGGRSLDMPDFRKSAHA